MRIKDSIATSVATKKIEMLSENQVIGDGFGFSAIRNLVRVNGKRESHRLTEWREEMPKCMKDKQKPYVYLAKPVIDRYSF